MNKSSARQTIKAINRWVRKNNPFEGGKQYGVDFATWNVCYPQLSKMYVKCAEIMVERTGRFMPRF